MLDEEWKIKEQSGCRTPGLLRLFQNTTSQVLELGFDEASTVFVTEFHELSIPSSCKRSVPSTSCAQERPDSDTPQGAPGPQPTPLRPSYPRSHMGRSWAMVLWKIKKRTKTRGGRGEGTREGGDGQEKTMKYHARSETGNKDQGIRFTQADAPTLPLQPPSAPQLPASASPRHLRDKDKRLIPATSLETTR